jgi:hypothetical protein
MSDQTATTSESVNTTVAVTPSPAPAAQPLNDLLTLQKGYFADVYENRTSSIYFLTSLLADALERIDWRTTSSWTEHPLTTEEALAELSVACDEFAAKVKEKLTPKWTKDDGTISKSATAALADPALRLEQHPFLSPLPLATAILKKAGKRNSASDAVLIQSVHDTSVELDAKCVMQKSVTLAPNAAASPVEANALETLQKSFAAEKLGFQQALTKALANASQMADQIEQLQREAVSWKAASQTSRAALEAYAQQPLEADT